MKPALTVGSHSKSLAYDPVFEPIYFVEKDQSTGASELYSLDEFSPRNNEDIRKAYMLGRYGSVPNVGDGDLLWQ